MRLFLVRHGDTGDQYAGRYIGATDLPLSIIGCEQAARLADRLPATLCRCLISPMRRARETAAIALAGRECRLQVMAALKEIDFGRWEGLSFAEIVAKDQALVNAWQQDALAFCFPEGEQTLGFWQRVQEALQAIVALPDEEILVICHGGVIRAMLCGLLGLPFDRYLSFAIKPATMAVVDVHGRQGVLVGLNW
jgi:broad specificity phosphatase PhoE